MELSVGRIPAQEKPKQVRLTNDQVVEVLKKAKERIQKETGWKILDGWLVIYSFIFLGTGLRRREALLARWEHISWEDHSLLIPASNAKDKEERRVGLGRRLYDELRIRRQEKSYIVPQFNQTTVTKAITQHFALCGFKMRLHDTRHTYVTLLEEDAGAAPHEAMQRTGHDDMAMLSRYTHPRFVEVLEDRLRFMQVEEEGNETRH